MSVSGRGAAGIAAAVALAALVSACAAPSPGGPTMGRDGTSAMSPSNLQSPSHPPDIKDLAGLKPAEIVSILGQPDLKRDEPPAELWQYRAADCVLNLFFYDNAGNERLTHAEAWQRSLSAGSTPARCHDEDAPIKAHFITQSAL
jgi:hypothetical protein